MKISFDSVLHSLDEIKESFYLNEIFSDYINQRENVATTLQSLFFYGDLVKAIRSNDNPNNKTILASLCRTITIMSYSVIEAYVIATGGKIQSKCKECKHKCKNYLIFAKHNMFLSKSHADVFYKADGFLKEVELLTFGDKKVEKIYRHFRESRNNVHLAKNAEIIYKDPDYMPEYTGIFLGFVEVFINEIYKGYKHLLSCYKC